MQVLIPDSPIKRLLIRIFGSFEGESPHAGFFERSKS